MAPAAACYLEWGYYPSDNIPDSVSVVIRRNIFAGAGNADDQGLVLQWLAWGSQTFSARLVENLVHGNGDGSSNACTGFSPYGAVSLETYTGASASFTLNNNTVVNNGAGCGVSVTPTANLIAYNNIFYGNQHSWPGSVHRYAGNGGPRRYRDRQPCLRLSSRSRSRHADGQSKTERQFSALSNPTAVAGDQLRR